MPHIKLIAILLLSFAIAEVKTRTCCDGILETHRDIIKRPNDNRSIEGYTLTNGLKLLLISDPSTATAAASLNVNVGSMSSPKSLPGLPHLLEHMIFFNSEKFPDSDEFSNFVYENGGNVNARTHLTNTIYHFEIPTNRFREAFERFVTHFGRLVFSGKKIENEINIVESEFQGYLYSDSWRLHRVLMENANPIHPFTIFTVGNLESLKISNKTNNSLKEELFKFYEKYYSSNIMSNEIFVEPIDKMKEMVVPLLNKIRNRNISAPKWSESPYKPQQLKKKIEFVPVEDKHKLLLWFPLSDMSKHFKSKPWMYITQLLNQKGDGSLSIYLKKKNMCTVIKSDVEIISEFGLMQIELELTKKGIDRVYEVIESIFQYINMIKDLEKQRKIFYEIQKLLRINFQFGEKADASDEVIYTSSLMQNHSINEIFTEEEPVDEFKPQLIKEFLNFMNPENVLVAISSPKFENKTNKREKWYGVNYNKREDNYDEPKMLKNDENSRIWFFKDFRFGARAYFALYIKSPFIHIDPLYTVCAKILNLIIKYDLESVLTKGEEAGLSFESKIFKYGIEFHAHGYSDKLSLFVLRMIEALSNFEFNEQSFNNIKRDYFTNLKDLKSKNALSIAFSYAKGILQPLEWIDEEQLAVEEELSFNTFQVVMKNIFSKVFIESFAYGNYESKEVIDLADEIARKLKCRFLMLPSHHYARNVRSYRLPYSSTFVIKASSFENLNGIVVYFQIGRKNISTSVKLQMLNQFMSQRFYGVLRSTELLGYTVSTFLPEDEGYNVGLIFYIESSNSTEYIDHRIEEFIKSFKAELETMKSENFEDIRKEVLNAYKKTPENLKSFADRFSKEFREGTYMFNRPDLSVSEAEKITKQDLLQMLDDYMICGAKYRAKLSVRVENAQLKAISVPAIKFCSQSKLIKLEELNDFKSRLPLYRSKHQYLPKPLSKKRHLKNN
ncbi:insulin-degrading enzyme-like isoform X3, partial [Dinothrombium tinctorium]